ncbi:MAG: mandelate racemase/muconate lactonizing enzyme family protein [Capsulimonadales bacterium]|nr:mandelate racemase/muconate lactonizing enzyme family protein [Capsulimonadales bacterium]
MKIARLETFTFEASTEGSSERLDPSSHTIVVRLTDVDGRTGIGEADAPPDAVRAFLEMRHAHDLSQRLSDLLIGADPLEAPALWDRSYEATLYTGRRGLGIHALSAVDMALYDLAGKQYQVPAYRLLGGARRARLTPYATCYVGSAADRTVTQHTDALLDLLRRAVALGFRAVKAELLFPEMTSDQLIAAIRAAREAVGPNIELIADFGYRFTDWREAAYVLRASEDCRLFFAEATLSHDDLAGHARLADAVAVRIGGAEFAATRWECREWLERGKVDVLQPDINRCGGLTEIRRIAEMAQWYGALVVPHAWKTGITVAACRHFQAATANAPFFEFLSPLLWPSELRRALVTPEPTLAEDGTMALPDAPGLGVALTSGDFPETSHAETAP